MIQRPRKENKNKNFLLHRPEKVFGCKNHSHLVHMNRDLNAKLWQFFESTKTQILVRVQKVNFPRIDDIHYFLHPKTATQTSNVFFGKEISLGELLLDL